MALQLSQRDLKKAASKFEQIKNRIQTIKKKAERTTEKVIRTAEVGGASFAMGVMQGKFYDPQSQKAIEVLGVPLELGLGIGLNALGYFGGAGKHSDHLNNIGDGCLAAYAATLGRGVGSTWKERGRLGGGAAGSIAARPEVKLTNAELETAARMAAAAKAP